MSKNNHKRNKRHIRSTLTGKIINGKEVVLVEEAVEYVKKMGYSVRLLSEVYAKGGLMVMGLMLFLTILIIPFVSAQPALFTIDFALRQNQIILCLFFAMAGFLVWFKQRLWGGSLILIAGMLMAFNDINLIICLFVMGVGILLITMEGGEE